MQVFLNVFTPKSVSGSYNEQKQNYSRLNASNRDIVSFGALKKSHFSGINLSIVERFKAPIEKFNSIADFYEWSAKNVEKVTGKDLHGRKEFITTRRNAIFREWYEHVTNKNEGYTPAEQHFILDSITSDLKPNNDRLPPKLNKSLLAKSLDYVKKELGKDSKQQFNLNKIYQKELISQYVGNTKIDENLTKWVVIPSLEHDPANFTKNLEMLKECSSNHWCTKTTEGEHYLEKGDFHIYIENGKPKLVLRLQGGVVKEIRDAAGNGVSVPYFDLIEKRINENSLKLSEQMDLDVKAAKKIKNGIDKAKLELKDAIKNNDVKKILEYFGIGCEKLSNGMLKIDKYVQPELFKYKDVGISENKLLEHIEVISGNANLRDSDATTLGNLLEIMGNADLNFNQIEDLGKLRRVGKNLSILETKVKSLGDLTSIGGNVNLGSSVESLGKLSNVGGNLRLGSSVADLGELQTVRGNVMLNSNFSMDDFAKIKVYGSISPSFNLKNGMAKSGNRTPSFDWRFANRGMR